MSASILKILKEDEPSPLGPSAVPWALSDNSPVGVTQNKTQGSQVLSVGYDFISQHL